MIKSHVQDGGWMLGWRVKTGAGVAAGHDLLMRRRRQLQDVHP